MSCLVTENSVTSVAPVRRARRPLPIIGTNRIERIASAAAAANIGLLREDWYALWEAAQGQKVP